MPWRTAQSTPAEWHAGHHPVSPAGLARLSLGSRQLPQFHVGLVTKLFCYYTRGLGFRAPHDPQKRSHTPALGSGISSWMDTGPSGPSLCSTLVTQEVASRVSLESPCPHTSEWRPAGKLLPILPFLPIPSLPSLPSLSYSPPTPLLPSPH